MSKRNLSLIILGLFIGAAIGGVMGNLLGWVLPEGVVKDFFLTSLSLDIGGLAGNEMGEIGRASLGKECRSRWSPYH